MLTGSISRDTANPSGEMQSLIPCPPAPPAPSGWKLRWMPGAWEGKKCWVALRCSEFSWRFSFSLWGTEYSEEPGPVTPRGGMWWGGGAWFQRAETYVYCAWNSGYDGRSHHDMVKQLPSNFKKLQWACQGVKLVLSTQNIAEARKGRGLTARGKSRNSVLFDRISKDLN